MTARTEVQHAQAEQQFEALNRLLVATDIALRADQPVPCLGTYELANASANCPSGPNPWLSDDPDDRTVAAQACNGCPVAAECLAYGQAHRATFGVYGGRDFTTKAQDAAGAR